MQTKAIGADAPSHIVRWWSTIETTMMLFSIDDDQQNWFWRCGIADDVVAFLSGRTVYSRGVYPLHILHRETNINIHIRYDCICSHRDAMRHDCHSWASSLQKHVHKYIVWGTTIVLLLQVRQDQMYARGTQASEWHRDYWSDNFARVCFLYRILKNLNWFVNIYKVHECAYLC